MDLGFGVQGSGLRPARMETTPGPSASSMIRSTVRLPKRRMGPERIKGRHHQQGPSVHLHSHMWEALLLPAWPLRINVQGSGLRPARTETTPGPSASSMIRSTFARVCEGRCRV